MNDKNVLCSVLITLLPINAYNTNQTRSFAVSMVNFLNTRDHRIMDLGPKCAIATVSGELGFLSHSLLMTTLQVGWLFLIYSQVNRNLEKLGKWAKIDSLIPCDPSLFHPLSSWKLVCFTELSIEGMLNRASELSDICWNNKLNQSFCVVQVHSDHLKKIRHCFPLEFGKSNMKICKRTILTS